MNFNKTILCVVILISHISYAEDFNHDILFDGINEQIHDYSCGSAALSTLISGVYADSEVNRLVLTLKNN